MAYRNLLFFFLYYKHTKCVFFSRCSHCCPFLHLRLQCTHILSSIELLLLFVCYSVSSLLLLLQQLFFCLFNVVCVAYLLVTDSQTYCICNARLFFTIRYNCCVSVIFVGCLLFFDFFCSFYFFRWFCNYPSTTINVDDFQIQMEIISFFFFCYVWTYLNHSQNMCVRVKFHGRFHIWL